MTSRPWASFSAFVRPSSLLYATAPRPHPTLSPAWGRGCVSGAQRALVRLPRQPSCPQGGAVSNVSLRWRWFWKYRGQRPEICTRRDRKNNEPRAAGRRIADHCWATCLPSQASLPRSCRSAASFSFILLVLTETRRSNEQVKVLHPWAQRCGCSLPRRQMAAVHDPGYHLYYLKKERLRASVSP